MLISNEGHNNKDTIIYRIAGYIGKNNVWRIGRKQKQLADINLAGTGTIATPSLRVYAILADLILAV